MVEIFIDQYELLLGNLFLQIGFLNLRPRCKGDESTDNNQCIQYIPDVSTIGSRMKYHSQIDYLQCIKHYETDCFY